MSIAKDFHSATFYYFIFHVTYSPAAAVYRIDTWIGHDKMPQQLNESFYE